MHSHFPTVAHVVFPETERDTPSPLSDIKLRLREFVCFVQPITVTARRKAEGRSVLAQPPLDPIACVFTHFKLLLPHRLGMLS